MSVFEERLDELLEDYADENVNTNWFEAARADMINYVTELESSNKAWKELAEELGNKYDIRWCMTKCNVGANGYVHSPACPITKLENMKKEQK